MPPYRIGSGHDLHRTQPAQDHEGQLILGGLRIPAAYTLVAHSDGDVVLHAVTDALLGAIGAGDIGDLFPDTDDVNRHRDSAEFVAEALHRVHAFGYAVVNVDLTIFMESPKLLPYKIAMRERLAAMLGIDPTYVSVKAKTGEGLDAVGRKEAVSAHAVVLIQQTS